MAISNAASGFRPGVCTSTTRPTSPFNGQVIYETDTKQTLVWQGAAWVMLTDADTPPGLQLVKTQAVGSTAVTSVVLVSVFSSEFDNYRVIYSGGKMNTTSNDMTLQLGPSSVGGYNSSYVTSLFYATGGASAYAETNTTAFAWVGGGSTNACYLSVDLFNPYLAMYTRSHCGAYQNGTAIGNSVGEHRQTGQYTDITISSGSSFKDGTVYVYGFRK